MKNNKIAIAENETNIIDNNNSETTESKKKSKAKIILLCVALSIVLVSGILYFSGIGERMFRELEHQFTGKIQTSDGYYVGDTDFGVFNGNGTLKYDFGKSISGVWSDGILSGNAVAEFDELGKYEGNYENSVRSGKGTFTWTNGDVYTGEWSDDKINGTGKITWSDGSVYEGEFKDNRLSGEGVLTLENGDKYTGSFLNGKINGNGILQFASGDKYDGEWYNGMLSGDGTFTWKNGDTYTGSFADNCFSGEGDLELSDGGYLKGTFEDGKLTDGTGYRKSKNASYTFKYEGRKISKAKIEFSDKAKYEGEYSDNAFNGNGTFTYKNGDTYAGEFKNGLRSGTGTYNWKNSGAKYDGELMLTLLASFAQEESRSISENIKWATRKRFEKGIPNGHKAPYGYEWDGEVFRIIPEQGEVVKEIYSRYLAGESAYIIAKTLAERGVTGQMGKPIEQTTVKEILSSRSYTGTMVLQKNYLTEGHIRKRNKGELPMYLVDEMFEPLVSEEDYQKALEIRQQRAGQFPNNQDNLTAFSGKVKCGYCGCGVSRRTSGDRKRWVCNTRERKGMKQCECRPIWETELTAASETVLGGSIDDGSFSKEIQQVTLYSDRIEFSLLNGNRKSIIRQFSGRRGQNAFTNKVWCGSCGCKCERDNYGKKKTKIWCCSQPRTQCQMKRLPESELLEAAESLLGENFQARVSADIDRVVVSDTQVDFEYKDGAVKTWQRK